MDKLDQYLKIAEAAEMLGVAENTLRSWADHGKIPSTRNPANGYRLFRERDLGAYLKNMAQSVWEPMAELAQRQRLASDTGNGPSAATLATPQV